VLDEVLGDEGKLGEVAEDRLEIKGERPVQRWPRSKGANGTGLLAVSSERQPMVQGGGPSSGGAQGGRLGAARPAVISSGARGAERSRAAARDVGVVSEEEKSHGVFLLLEQWRDKAVAHGMHVEARRGRWHGEVRQERPLGFSLARCTRERQVASG
jgi:hypothetical protein